MEKEVYIYMYRQVQIRINKFRKIYNGQRIFLEKEEIKKGGKY